MSARLPEGSSFSNEARAAKTRAATQLEASSEGEQTFGASQSANGLNASYERRCMNVSSA